MTVREYITQKTAHLNLALTEADWLDIAGGVSLTAEATPANIRAALSELAKTVLPFCRSRATSVSENGFSISHREKDLDDFYLWICDYLGVEPVLPGLSKISDATGMW
jgi:hypothetical protein